MSKKSKALRAKSHNAEIIALATAYAEAQADYRLMLAAGKAKRKVKSQGVGTRPTGKRNHALKDGKAGLAMRELHGYGKQVCADDKTAAQASTNFKPPVTPKWAASKIITEKARKRAGTLKG